MILTQIYNLIEEAEKQTQPLNYTQALKSVNTKMSQARTSISRPGLLRQQAAKNMVARQRALQRDPVLKRLEAQRAARLARDKVSSSVLSI